MGWITLGIRKKTLQNDINSYEFQDIQMARELRSVHRHLSYEQSAFKADQTSELKAIKDPLTSIRNARPNVNSSEYEEWQQQYTEAKEKYEQQKADIQDYYDDVMQDLENEANDREVEIQEEQTTIETQLQAMRAELETINDQIKSDIDSQKISLS